MTDPLTEHERSIIDDAVRRDYEWVSGEAQRYDAWRGTEPDDVTPLDLPEGAVMGELRRLTLDRAERYDRAIEYALDRWGYYCKEDL